ncbi:MAG: COG4223 family protein [Alphaproteobacteria bacterium]
MSASKKQPIENAVEIIEAFGGLRPMSSKIGVAVTTIQGWKKRGVIPASRKEAILQAAQDHDIDLSKVFDDAPSPQNQEADASKDDEVLIEDAVEDTQADNDSDEISDVQSGDANDKKEADVAEVTEIASVPPVSEQAETTQRISASKANEFRASPKPSSDKNFTELAIETENRAVTKSALIAAVMVVVVLVAIVATLWPDYKEFDEHGMRLSTVEDDVSDIKNQQAMFKGLVPENWEEQLESLQKQVNDAGKAVGETVETVQSVSQDIMNGELMTGDLEERVVQLQTYVSELTGNEGVTHLMDRFDAMRQNVMGQETLNETMTHLSTLMAGSNKTDEGQVNAMLDTARSENGALSTTFEGVPKNELKAATMLFALTQVRSALNRKDDAFDGDLELLMGMVGEENVELRSSLEKLAPHSKSGVLSAEGLKSEFQSVAGDVVAASLRGEDVSFGEQMSARMNDILKVEKDGELVTGTETQATMNKAEQMVMEDKFSEATSYLKDQLSAGELAPLRPWMEKVEGVLASQQVKDAIEQAIDFSSGEGFLGGAQILTE